MGTQAHFPADDLCQTLIDTLMSLRDSGGKVELVEGSLSYNSFVGPNHSDRVLNLTFRLKDGVILNGFEIAGPPERGEVEVVRGLPAPQGKLEQ